MTAPTKVTPISGFPELLPAERLLELHVLDVVRDYRFCPLWIDSSTYKGFR